MGIIKDINGKEVYVNQNNQSKAEDAFKAFNKERLTPLVVLENIIFDGLDFTNPSGTWNGCTLDNVVFNNCTISLERFENCVMKDASFNDCKIKNTRIEKMFFCMSPYDSKGGTFYKDLANAFGKLTASELESEVEYYTAGASPILYYLRKFLKAEKESVETLREQNIVLDLEFRGLLSIIKELRESNQEEELNEYIERFNVNKQKRKETASAIRDSKVKYKYIQQCYNECRLDMDMRYEKYDKSEPMLNN